MWHGIMTTCEKCGEMFSNSFDLLSHQKLSCQKQQLRQYYECDQCNEKFTRSDNLNQHIAFLHAFKKKYKTFNCLHCPQEFTSRKDLEKHVVALHMAELNAENGGKVCKRCGKKFSTVNTMKRHIRTVHPKRTQQAHFECNECKAKFTRKDGLLRHIQCLHMHQETSFRCSYCSKEFKFKSNCLKHVRRIHLTKKKKSSDDSEKVCQQCGKKFTSSYNVKRHYTSVHGTKVTLGKNTLSALFECNECNAKYTRKDGLLRHIECLHVIGKKSYVCVHCSRKYSSRYSLKQHLRSCVSQDGTKCNKKTSDHSRVKGLKCLICYRNFDLTNLINDHYEKDHSIVFVYEHFEFVSRTEFVNWMNKKRKIPIKCFLRNTWETETHIAKVFRCHRSGRKRKKIAPKRKRADSIKLNGFCPMCITLKESKINGKCSVSYQKTHVGHSFEEEKLSSTLLKKKEELDITNEVSLAVKSGTISENESSKHQENFSLNVSSRGNVVNITKKRVSVCRDDSLNIRKFIIKNRDSILFYKEQGKLDERFPELAKEDFALGYMDSNQERALKRYGHKIVAFNGTYGANPNFILHTISVQDVDYEGYPVAFLLSNRNDLVVINTLLQRIKLRVGFVKPKVIMSDAQHFYFNAWIEEMGPVLNKLYCSWDVNEAWKRMYLKINDRKLRQAVKEKVENLSRELDKELFEQKLNDLMTNYDVEMLNFLKYFCRYVNTKEYWAYCYKNHSGYSTNMGFEKFHKTFKDKAATGRRIKSVYEILCLLQTYLKWKEDDIENKSVSGKTCHETRIIRKKHKQAEEQFMSREISIVQVTQNCWQVLFCQDTDDVLEQEFYTVQKLIVKECTQYSDTVCLLPCTKCKICHHDFVCSCPDNAIRNYMCEHIHALGICLLNEKFTEDELTDEEEHNREELAFAQKTSDRKVTARVEEDFNPEELLYVDEEINEEVMVHADEEFNKIEMVHVQDEDFKQIEVVHVDVDEDYKQVEMVNVDEVFKSELEVYADEMVHADEVFKPKLVVCADEMIHVDEVFKPELVGSADEMVHVDEVFKPEEVVLVDKDFKQEEAVHEDKEFNQANVTGVDSVILARNSYIGRPTEDICGIRSLYHIEGHR